MKRENAKKLAVAGLVAALAALAVDDVVLHQKIGQMRQEVETRLELLEEEAAVSAADRAEQARERAEQARGWWVKTREKWQQKWMEWRKQSD